jgi:hypothetical protein
MSNPIAGFFSPLASSYLQNMPVTGLYCHSEFLGRKEREVADLSLENFDLAELVMNTLYPDPQTWENVKR